jgi:hypothetical protein
MAIFGKEVWCRGEKEQTKYRVKGQVYEVLTVQVVKYLKTHKLT